MRILVALNLDEEQRGWLEAAAPEGDFHYVKSPGEEELRQADILIGNVPPAALKHAERLKWLQLSSAGADTYCQPGVLPENVILTNATGAYGLTISEYMIGATIMLYKHLHLYDRQKTRHEWKALGPIRSISGSTVLSIGLGDIGATFCRKAKALGAYTIGVKRRPGEKPEGVDELHLIEELDSLLPRADIVALSLPNTPATTGLMCKERFKLLKPGAILINVGRGNSVNTEDLIEALQNGDLSGAILDVFDPEPLPADNPLWDMDNVILTPHIAGGFYLRETLNRIVRIAAHNLSAFVSGGEMCSTVDRSTGYRR